MIVEIDTAQNNMWNAKGTDRVVQNVINIMSTFKYEVSYDRTLGLNRNFTDRPLNQAIAEATTELIEEIEIKEPRAKVISVDFENIDSEGIMQYKVVVDIE